MKSIFKKTTGVPADNDIVGQYNFKASYPEVNRNMAWAELTPYIRQATRRFILPYIGQEQYDDIATKIQAGDSISDELTEFAERLRDAVAYYTISVALPKKKTVVTSMGSVENQANEGTTTTSQWGFRTTLWSVAQDADRLMDELLEYMEAQVANDNAEFNPWKVSDAFNAGKSDLFRQPSEFQVYQNIGNSRRSFIAMLPIIKQAARHHIVPIISQAQYDDLVVKYQSNALSDDDKALLDKVRAALAPWSVYQATNKLAVITDQDAWRVVSNVDAIDQRAYSSEVIQSAIQRLRDGAELDARTNTADLIDFMYQKKDTYTFYKASEANPDNDRSYYVPPIGSEYGAVML